MSLGNDDWNPVKLKTVKLVIIADMHHALFHLFGNQLEGTKRKIFLQRFQ